MSQEEREMRAQAKAGLLILRRWREHLERRARRHAFIVLRAPPVRCAIVCGRMLS